LGLLILPTSKIARLACGWRRFLFGFGDHMHRFDGGGNDAGATEILEAHHRPGVTAGGQMILLNNVVRCLSRWSRP
jgi:hypothetical protein